MQQSQIILTQSNCPNSLGLIYIFTLFHNPVSAGPIPLRIREARVPIVNDNECVRKINTVTEKIFILPASSFCAGGERGHDACQVIILTFDDDDDDDDDDDERGVTMLIR